MTVLILAQANNPIYKDVLTPLIRGLSLLVGIVVIGSLIVAGIQYITSDGSPQSVAAAKTRISASVVAFVVYLLAFAVLNYLIPGGLI